MFMKEIMTILFAVIMSACGTAAENAHTAPQTASQTLPQTASQTVTQTASQTAAADNAAVAVDESQLMTLTGFLFICENGSSLFVTDDGLPVILSGSLPCSQSGVPVQIRTMGIEESYPCQALVYDMELLPGKEIPSSVWDAVYSLDDMGYTVRIYSDFDMDEPGMYGTDILV